MGAVARIKRVNGRARVKMLKTPEEKARYKIHDGGNSKTATPVPVGGDWKRSYKKEWLFPF